MDTHILPPVVRPGDPAPASLIRARRDLVLGRVRMITLAELEAAENQPGPPRYMLAVDEGSDGLLWGWEAVPGGRLEIVSICCDASAIEG